VRAAVGTMVGGPWAGGSPGRGCSTRWLICGTGYWVLGGAGNNELHGLHRGADQTSAAQQSEDGGIDV
jgi:hypothetical protein